MVAQLLVKLTGIKEMSVQVDQRSLNTEAWRKAMLKIPHVKVILRIPDWDYDWKGAMQGLRNVTINCAPGRPGKYAPKEK